MHSKYLASLSSEERKNFEAKLHRQQSGKCFICGERIELGVSDVDIDHIVPLVNGGHDDVENLALTHASCNRAKQDADLNVARIFARLKKLRNEVEAREHCTLSLKHLLQDVGGSKFTFRWAIKDDELHYSFDDLGDAKIFVAPIFCDERSKVKTAFLDVPVEYLFHDSLINPRGINNSVGLLVKEFYKGNPQLHLTLARIADGRVCVFDGQHKAAAQILLGARKICVRLFLSTDVNKLIETNRNAGSKLRQIAFDKAVMRQLNNAIYKEHIERYQKERHFSPDNFHFSEVELCQHFRADNMKKCIIDAIKSSITHSQENALRAYIDFDGKGKSLPISHSTFDKVFLSSFIDPKRILKTYMDSKTEDGENPRELEIAQISKVLSIIAETVFIGKFNREIGVYRIENRIADGKGADITDEHLTAYRMSKEEICHEWVPYLIKVIMTNFLNQNVSYEPGSMFQSKFPDNLWGLIEKFMTNLSMLPLWKDRGMAQSHFSGKKTYEFWKTVFRTGKTPDGVDVISEGLDINKLIR